MYTRAYNYVCAYVCVHRYHVSGVPVLSLLCVVSCCCDMSRATAVCVFCSDEQTCLNTDGDDSLLHLLRQTTPADWPYCQSSYEDSGFHRV